MKPVVLDVVPATPRTAPGMRMPHRNDARTEAKRLAADIERAIRVRTGRTVHDLAVQVTKEGIVLTGSCSTYYTKQLAQHAAMTLLAHERLVNDIEVA